MNLHDLILEYKSELISALIGATISVLVFVIFIGRNRMAWAVKELIKMYSANEKSYFGKKRIESGIAFVVAEHGAIFWLAKKYDVMTTMDFCAWLTIQLFIAGWYVNQIQKEKVEVGKPLEEQPK